METREKHPETIQNALRAGNPTYQFREGDAVRVGINNRRTVLEVLDNGLCYLTENEAGTTCVYPWYRTVSAFWTPSFLGWTLEDSSCGKEAMKNICRMA